MSTHSPAAMFLHLGCTKAVGNAAAVICFWSHVFAVDDGIGSSPLHLEGNGSDLGHAVRDRWDNGDGFLLR